MTRPTNDNIYQRAKDRNEGREPDELHLAYETELLALRGEIAGLRAQLHDYRHLFDVQWRRMAAATARWRAEDPVARDLISPDLGDLLEWLMAAADARESGAS